MKLSLKLMLFFLLIFGSKKLDNEKVWINKNCIPHEWLLDNPIHFLRKNKMFLNFSKNQLFPMKNNEPSITEEKDRNTIGLDFKIFTDEVSVKPIQEIKNIIHRIHFSKITNICYRAVE